MQVENLPLDIDTETHCVLKKEHALLVIKSGTSDFLCLRICHAADKSPQWPQNITSFKFIGNLNLWDALVLQKNSWLELCEKKIITNEDINLKIIAKQKKVLFLNNHTPTNKTLDKSKKRVLIIDDSKTIRNLLSKIVEKSQELEVMATAGSPSEALAILKNRLPDLITLDIHMPEMTGVDFLKKHLSHYDIPVIMISSVSINEGPLVLEALSSGAATYIQKPSLDKMQEVELDIIEKMETLSKNKKRNTLSVQKKIKSNFISNKGLIAIGSSTGGTQALQEIFTALPAQIPPIVVTQHIPSVFSKALADRLNTLCPFTIAEAVNGQVIAPNNIYIAPGGQQMKVINKNGQRVIEINDDPPLNRFKPSVDYLFDSVSKINESVLVGIILTGMGRDGAQGLLHLKQAGANTIAQDAESSVVFGMPKEAIKLGAAMAISSLNDIPEKMIDLYNQKILSKRSA